MADNSEIKSKVKKGSHEPFITITKRKNVSLKRSIAVRACAILSALVFCGLLTMLITKQDPIKIYASMVEGNFGTSRITMVTLREIAILLSIAIALAPSFKMKFWNTGAEGQVLVGALSTALVMFYLGGKVPEWLLMIIMTLAAILAGAIWGFIPAFFKSRWGTNETLFTLMLNYVAIQFVEFFLKVADKSGSNTVGPSLLSHGWFPDIFGERNLLAIIIAIALSVFMYFYLYKSKHGYEITVVGESSNTAKYIGIDVKKVITRTVILSGALCGLVGLMLTGMIHHSIDANLAGGNGFTAIMVAWLAKFNPIFMFLSSFLLVFLSRGASEVSLRQGLNESYSEILTGIILFFIIGCEFFLNYQMHFRTHHKKHTSDSNKECNLSEKAEVSEKAGKEAQ